MIKVHDFSTNDLWRLRVSRPGRADLYLQETADGTWDVIQVGYEVMVGKLGMLPGRVEGWLRDHALPELDILMDMGDGLR